MAENDNTLPPLDDVSDEVLTRADDTDNSDPKAPDKPTTDDLGARLERLGGEPAPDITPEEFARLQQAGQIHIDPRGRVRTTTRDETDAGISLRKRRAWYRDHDES